MEAQRHPEDYDGIIAGCAANDRIFWFVHISDLHVGMSGTADTDRLRWVVATAQPVRPATSTSHGRMVGRTPIARSSPCTG